MMAFIDNLEQRAEGNGDFRHVIFTGPELQLVLMSLAPGEEIGEETHDDTDQFFRIEAGTGEVVLEGNGTPISGGMGIVVPAGTRHNLRNTGQEAMKLYTIYAPPHHADGTVQHTKADAEKAAAHAG